TPAQTKKGRNEACANRGACDSTGVEGRLDLAAARRQAPGDRRRPGWTAAVSLPPRISRAAGAGEVRQARTVCRAAARSAQGDVEAHRRRAALAGLGLRARSGFDQSRLVSLRYPM